MEALKNLPTPGIIDDPIWDLGASQGVNLGFPEIA
jgi:hypothetical protein